MNDQHELVADDEHVYRRIPGVFYVPTLPVRVQFPAFRPNQEDTTGLSVFRAKFVNPADTLANVASAKQANYYVARLAVRDMLALGLNVVPEPAQRDLTDTASFLSCAGPPTKRTRSG